MAQTMAVSMLTPRDLGRDASRVGRWSRALLQGVRQNIVPWVAVKATLIALLFAGRLGVGAAFVLPSKRFSLKLGGVLSEGEVGTAIRQVREYARSKSIQFAVATNGRLHEEVLAGLRPR